MEQHMLNRGAGWPPQPAAAPPPPPADPPRRRLQQEGRPAGPSATDRRSEVVRRDIQGLRAVAVLVVLLFHFWPEHLTGGYVGVDVFFVISGFLISSHLLRSPPVTPRLLAAFWARRVRRLLPAASLVLLATLAASLVWLPSTQLPTVARETIASALSVENWALAATATDYLAQDSAPSPLQHYWSLSVEEQFYVLWPVLIALMFFLGRRTRPIVWAGFGLGVVTALSLATSVHLTQSDPPAAYFVTHTRVWELGLGSLLALAVHLGWRVRHLVVRAALGWAGLGMIAWAAVTYDSGTPFPGTAALLPTLGAALVIAADTDGVPWSPRAVMGWWPSQRLGDISYSLYLWHWPVVVIAPFALGGPLHWGQKVALLSAVLVVSTVSKSYVEDPVRRAPFLVTSLPRSFALALTSVLVLCGGGLAVIQRADAALAAQQQTLARGMTGGSQCLGAAALRDPGCRSIQGDSLLSSPAVARDDRSVTYRDGCWSNRPFTAHRICTYGNPSGATRVALLGNSHAGHWQPALADIAGRRGWRLDTYLVSQCYTVTIPIAFTPQTVSANCSAWNRWAIGAIAKGHYDLVVISNRTFQPLVGVPPGDKARVAAQAYRQTLASLTHSGVRVLVLRDVPSAVNPAPDCVDAHLGDVSACDNDARRAVQPDPLDEAARSDKSGLVSRLDLTDRFCRQGRCHVVIGGLIAYFDHGHMTTAFARTLIPDIAPALDSSLARSAAP